MKRVILSLVFASLAVGGSARATGTNPSSILVAVPCGDNDGGNQNAGSPAFPKCDQLKPNAAPDHMPNPPGVFHGSFEWYSGNTLLYVENEPMAISNFDGGHPSVLLELTANGDTQQFASIYESLATSILSASNLNYKIWYTNDPHKGPQLVVAQPYVVEPSALWAKHSEDTPGLSAAITAEQTRAHAAEGTLTGLIAAETSARAAAIAMEVANRNAAIGIAISNEVTARNAAIASAVSIQAEAQALSDLGLAEEIISLTGIVNSQIASIHVSFPVTSTGGTNPTIALSVCPDGQLLVASGGSWECKATPPAVVPGPTIYLVQSKNCPGNASGGSISNSATCSYAPACSTDVNVMPACDALCSQESVSDYTACTPFGGCLVVGNCVTCSCPNSAVGHMIQ